jgi:teichoic acid transport system ATP-binding protein
MEDIAIKVEGLSKVYKIFDKPIDRLKESLNPFHKRYSKDFYALNGLSFEIKKGETVGIIGKNGAGKSTLLKIVTGVLTESGGTIEVNGRIASLLELGAGFNLEMTGIENIYMTGTILGYNKIEMDKRIDEILSFADIGDFIYQPVKMYSSGMFARLAFAVNVNVSPDILIVDEALSVGDVFFQNKCFKKFEELKNLGITIMFVSHDMGSIKQLCSKVLWIENGMQKMFGGKKYVCEAYYNEEIKKRNALNKDMAMFDQKHISIIKKRDKVVFPKLKKSVNGENIISTEVEIKSFFLENENREVVTVLSGGEFYKAVIVAAFYKKLEDVIFGFVLENNKGIQILGINSFINTKEKVIDIDEEKIVVVSFGFELPKILSGRYLISPAIAKGAQDKHIICTWLSNLVEIEIENTGYELSLIEIESKVETVSYKEENVKYM